MNLHKLGYSLLCILLLLLFGNAFVHTGMALWHDQFGKALVWAYVAWLSLKTADKASDHSY